MIYLLTPWRWVSITHMHQLLHSATIMHFKYNVITGNVQPRRPRMQSSTTYSLVVVPKPCCSLSLNCMVSVCIILLLGSHLAWTSYTRDSICFKLSVSSSTKCRCACFRFSKRGKLIKDLTRQLATQNTAGYN